MRKRRDSEKRRGERKRKGKKIKGVYKYPVFQAIIRKDRIKKCVSFRIKSDFKFAYETH